MLGIGLVVSEDLKKYAIASVGHVVRLIRTKLCIFIGDHQYTILAKGGSNWPSSFRVINQNMK
jgi:hypothetical protein